MSIFIADHHLKDVDTWFEMFTANPPPDIGNWRLIRGIDDPNRVQVLGEMTAPEVEDVKDYLKSERMQNVFKRVNEISTSPVSFTGFDEVVPG